MTLIFWPPRIFLACAFALVASGVGPAQADDFVLGPGDKVAVTIYKRPDISGEFRVQPGGDLSLPFLGALPVKGSTLAQARDAVAESLKRQASLLDPRVNLELVEARPIFVSGEVRRPGSYPFQSGMTVAHALSQAGGERTVELDEFNARAEVSHQRERFRQSQDGYGMALLRIARVKAERDAKAAFDAPDGAEAALGAQRLREGLESEIGVLAQRQEAYRAQRDVLGRQAKIFEEEIQALKDQDEFKARERTLVKDEGDYQEQLLNKGLTPRTGRTIELQRILVQVEGEIRQIAANTAKARQEIARIEQAKLLLENQRETELAATGREASDAAVNFKVTIEETRSLLLAANEALPEPGVHAQAQPQHYVIIRSGAEGSATLPAAASTLLLPGDLVEARKRQE